LSIESCLGEFNVRKIDIKVAFKAFPADENWFCQLRASKQLYRAEAVIFTTEQQRKDQ